MEKTIKEWLETLPEPIRTEALENITGEGVADVITEGFDDALQSAFVWSLSKQGFDYWDSVFSIAEAGEFNNLLLDKDSEK